MKLPFAFWKISGFSPVNVGDLSVWYKADAGVTLNGSTVSGWADQSGNGRHLIQSTATKQPLFIASAINSKPSLLFDGVDDLLSLASGATLSIFSDMSFFVVMKKNTASNTGVLAGGSGAYMYLQYNTTFYIGNTAKSAPMTLTTWYTRSGSAVNDGTKEYFSNATSLGVIVSGESAFYDAFNHVGGIPGFTSLNGEIAEVLVFKRVLNAIDRLKIDMYLQTKYAHY